MIAWTRYAVLIEEEQPDQEQIPLAQRHYEMRCFKEGFTTPEEARRYAEFTAFDLWELVKPRRVKALVYTLKPTECDCFFADESNDTVETK